MSAPHPGRTRALVGIAGAGLVLGHWLAYAVDTPHAHAREQLLRETGHGYLPYLTQVALLAGAIALAAAFLSTLRSRAAAGAFARDVAWLVAAQAGAFCVMEVGERLLSGAGLHDLTHGPLLAIGIGVQVAVAVAGAALLRLGDRAAGSIARRTDPPLPGARPGLTSLFVERAGAVRPPAILGIASRAPLPRLTSRQLHPVRDTRAGVAMFRQGRSTT